MNKYFLNYSFLLLLASRDAILTTVVLSGQFAKEFGIQLVHVEMQILVLDVLPPLLDHLEELGLEPTLLP